jgi:hypothetical protein
VKNEKLHASRGHDTIVVQIVNGDKAKKKKKKPTICCNLPLL